MTFIYTEGPLTIKKGTDLYTKVGSYIYTEGPLYKRRVLVYKEGPSIYRRVLLHKKALVCEEGFLYI